MAERRFYVRDAEGRFADTPGAKISSTSQAAQAFVREEGKAEAIARAMTLSARGGQANAAMAKALRVAAGDKVQRLRASSRRGGSGKTLPTGQRQVTVGSGKVKIRKGK